ncbi:MAG: CopG family transcriptional regulator [Ruminococcus sp.]|nr:CopG family transcriptional regulator [Ruminococcus sp.]
MSSKMGRPKSDNPKDVRFQIRADKETMEKLDYCAKENNSSRSEIIRQGIDLVYAKTKK